MTHWNWREELIQDPYNLKISEKDGFYLFKYSQLNSDFSKEICREARGVILDSRDNWKVVRLAFYKFFNQGEQYADQLDWDSAIATEKIDGSIMTLWYARGEWHLSTNGSINAADAQVNITNYTFKQVFDMATEKCELDYSKLNPQYNYTFELVSPYNRVVLQYDTPAIYHLSTRDMESLEEIEVDIGIQKPKQYECNSLKDYQLLVSKMDENHEGIVVRDKSYHRVKLKTLFYFDLHRKANNGHITLERALDIIRANEQEEFLVYFPEYKVYFSAIYEQYHDFLNTCNVINTNVQYWISNHINEPIISKNKRQEIHKKLRSSFAQFVKNYINPPYRFIAFSSYDYKMQQVIDELSSAKIIELTNMKDKVKLEELINYENN